MTRDQFLVECRKITKAPSASFVDLVDKLYSDVHRERRTLQRRYQRKIKQLEDKVSDVY